MTFGLLIQLGTNMWERPGAVADHVRCDERVWNEITARMAERGANMLVMDLGEALFYPSHPELAVKGTWSPEKMRAELARLRKMGIEPIPKLNFSSSHDPWLGEYSRMLSTETYYRVVADLVKDTAEIFDHPRLFHLGWDEETAKGQGNYQYLAVRQGDLWWHDMLYTAKEVERHGARAWIWSDKEWLHKDEFFAKCPRSVLQSPWYYCDGFGPNWEKRDDKKMREGPYAEPYTLCAFKELDEAGFDQIACGSNCGYKTNFPRLVEHCLKNVSKERLLGFLHAPWCDVTNAEGGKYRQRYLDAVDQLGDAVKRIG